MFKCTVEVNMVRYIAAILDYIAADILKVCVIVNAQCCTVLSVALVSNFVSETMHRDCFTAPSN